MKRLIAVAALGLSLALPNVSEAHGFFHGGHGGSGYRGGGYGYRGGGYGYRGGYGHGGGGLFGILALPFIAGAAIVGAAATVATAPFAGGDEPPAPAYYGPSAPAYYGSPAPSYYAPPAGYYPQQTYAPGYYPPQQGYYPPAYPGYYRGY